MGVIIVTWRESIPERYVNIRPAINETTVKYRLVLNPYAEFKLEWMEKHGGQCYCEPDGSRHCPCEFILSDLNRFNGSCLCTLFVTPSKMAKIEKYRSKPIKIVETDITNKKEKIKDAKVLFDKLYGKRV